MVGLGRAVGDAEVQDDDLADVPAAQKQIRRLNITSKISLEKINVQDAGGSCGESELAMQCVEGGDCWPPRR